MKLIRFALGDTRSGFGIVIGDRAVSFGILQHRSGITQPSLSDGEAYRAGLPDSERAERELLAWGEVHLEKSL